MKKNFVFLWIFVIIVILSACNSQKSQQDVIPSNTPKPLITPAPSLTQTAIKIFPFTPTPDPTYSPHTPEPTYPPYPTKQVTLEYLLSGNLSYFSYIVRERGTIFVLYTDGQFILTGKTYREKKLSTDEIKWLLSQLENKGFYSLETNQMHDQTDRLYNFGDQYFKVYDDRAFCVVVNGIKSRTIWVSESYKEFLVYSMKDILQFLDGYTPRKLSPYRPDRILIYVEKGRGSFFEQTKAVSWLNKFPSLETVNSKVIYADGAMAAEIFALFDYSTDWKVVNENGIEYTVIVRPVLPHETLSQP